MGQKSTQGHITITRQRNGEDGENSTRYYLVITPTCLISASDKKAFESGNTIHCEMWMQDGANKPKQTELDGCSVQVYKNTDTTPLLTRTAVSFDYIADASVVSYTFKMMRGGTCVDTVTVPIYERGKDSITLDLDNEMDSVPCNLQLQTEASTNKVYTTLTLYKGTTPIDMGNVSIEKSGGIVVEPEEAVSLSKRYKITVYDAAALRSEVKFKVNIGDVERAVTFTVNKIKPGVNGEPAVIYRVEPSVTAVKVNKNGVATPNHVTCKKTKQTGNGTPAETTDGYLCVHLSGSTTDKPYSDYGTSGVPVSGQSSIEFILYKSTSDKTVLDRETVPVIKDGTDGINGADGRGVVNTTIAYQIGNNGTVTPTGTWNVNVPTLIKGKYLWTRSITTYTTGDPTTLYTVSYIAKDGNNGDDGLPGKDGVGIKSTVITYARSTNGVTAPTSGWQSTIPSVPAGEYLWVKTVWTYTDNTTETGYSVARQGIDGQDGTDGKDGQDGISVHTNLLRQTVFDPAHMDMWDEVADNNVAQGLQYRNALHFNPNLDSPYINALQQPIYRPSGESVVEPGKWYTLSFYAKTRQFYTVMQQITSASYGFAGVPMYLKAGKTVTVRVYGYCSQAALSANRYLRVYLYKDGWGWSKYVDIKSTSLTLATITANDIPSDGLYHIMAFVYPQASASAPAQTAYVYSYEINRGGEIRTHIYPGCIDTTAGCYVDGELSSYVAVDGAMDYVLTTDFTRHSYSFKMKAPIPTSSICRALFRLTEASNEVWICMPKLEEGIHATDYMPNDLDISETAADQTGFPVDTGVFDNARVYKWDDVSRDFMEYEIDGQYYKFGVKYKGMTVSAGNPPASVNGDSNWEAVNRYSILIANTVFGTNANIGGFLTSNSVMKSQNESLVLDGRFGTINLKHSDGTEWYVDENGMQTLGYRDGQRIELDPAQRVMSIFNQAGEQVAVFEGNSYDSISSLFGNTSGSMTYINRTSLVAGYQSGVSMARGSLSDNTQGTASPRSGSSVFTLTSGITSDAPVEIVIASGKMYVEAHGGQDYVGANGVISPGHANVALQLRVATYTDSTKATLKGITVVRSVSFSAYNGQGGYNLNSDISNSKAKTQSGGFHVLEMYYIWNICGSGSSFYAHWGSTTKNFDSSGISVPTYSSDFYVSRYFANGFCLGTSARNYFWIRNNNGSMEFEGAVGDYGLKVDKDGIMMKHHNGNYQKLSQIVMWGKVTLNGSTVTSDLHTFDGSTLTVARTAEGWFNIQFPSAWSSLNLSESNCFVTLTGYVSGDKKILIKGSVVSITTSRIGFVLSDDASANDGTVFIKVEKLM